MHPLILKIPFIVAMFAVRKSTYFGVNQHHLRPASLSTRSWNRHASANNVLLLLPNRDSHSWLGRVVGANDFSKQADPVFKQLSIVLEELETRLGETQ
jgi:hypothetical protein